MEHLILIQYVVVVQFYFLLRSCTIFACIFSKPNLSHQIQVQLRTWLWMYVNLDFSISL